MYGDIPEEYYDAAANMVWDFGEGIDELFINHPEAISPALGLIENSDEDGLAILLWDLKILEQNPGVDPMRENKMKLTKRQLKQIIREEKRRLQEWGPGGPGDRGIEPEPAPKSLMSQMQSTYSAVKHLGELAHRDGDEELCDIADELVALIEERGFSGY